MSRGHGWLQRRLQEELDRFPLDTLDTYRLAGRVFELEADENGLYPACDRAKIVSVYRALRKLAAEGKVKCRGRGGFRGSAEWRSNLVANIAASRRQ